MDVAASLDNPATSVNQAEGGASLSRRGVLKLGVGALGGLALLELGSAGLLYLRAEGETEASGDVVTAGPIERFPAGSVVAFAAGRFYLVRTLDGGFLALHNRCTHLGCTVNWVPETSEFVCPCHAASFDAFGDFRGPPVPRPLDTFAVTFEKGMVCVDTGQPQHRERFEQGQLAYAPAPPIMPGSADGPALPAEGFDTKVEGAGP